MSRREAIRLAKEKNREILEEFKGPGVPVLMRCLRCGNESKHAPRLLRRVASSCNNCKPTRALQPDEAVELMRAAGLEPLTAYPGARKPWPARCTVCGEEGHPQLGNIRQGQKGCRTCSTYGFDVRKPTTLYVLVNERLKAVKIGITNTGSVRIRNFARSGWKPGRLYYFDEGRTPLHIETTILRRLRREKGLLPAVAQEEMRGARGATETFRASDVPTRLLYRMIRHLME